AEQVAEVSQIAEVEGEPAPGLEARPPVGRAPGVVLLALLRVGENVVRRLDLLEALLGILVAGVRVRVVLARELPVRLLDLVLRRALGDAQDLVEVPSGPRPHADPPRSQSREPASGPGRPAGSPSAGRRAR